MECTLRTAHLSKEFFKNIYLRSSKEIRARFQDVLAVTDVLPIFHSQPKQPRQELGQLGQQSPWEVLCLLPALQRERGAFRAPASPEQREQPLQSARWMVLHQPPLPILLGKDCDSCSVAKQHMNNAGTAQQSETWNWLSWTKRRSPSLS